jgi:hypothetical protein
MFRNTVDELNARAVNFDIGALQLIRKETKGHKRLPTRKIFAENSIFGDYAYHSGGRTELQFNVGLELIDEVPCFRHGLAFSLETNQTLPSIDVLIPKVERFNEFFRLQPDEYADFELWHYRGPKRSRNYAPGPIPHPWIEEDVFICLGKVYPVGDTDPALILTDFDRLLPLYRFVEGESSFPALPDALAGFQFKPGCSLKSASTSAARGAGRLDVQLRHNVLEFALYRELANQYGEDSVGTERPSGNGTRIDLVVQHRGEYWFYEIKTGASARACIREALAQLLEYAYWPGATRAARLIIAGEPALDPEAEAYLTELRASFALPVEYHQIRQVEQAE